MESVLWPHPFGALRGRRAAWREGGGAELGLVTSTVCDAKGRLNSVAIATNLDCFYDMHTVEVVWNIIIAYILEIMIQLKVNRKQNLLKYMETKI